MAILRQSAGGEAVNAGCLISVGQVFAGRAPATFRSTPSTRAGDVSKLSSRNSLLLTTAPTSPGRAAFAASRTAAQCAALRRLPKSNAMTKATHTTIIAACYFLVPLALCSGLILIGTFITGYLATANLWIAIVVLCGFFVAVFLSLVRKSHIKAIMLICSVSLIASCYWYFVGQERIRRYLYVAQITLTPNFERQCIPRDGLPLTNGDRLRLCSTHDFNLNGWIDSIVKIEGPYPKDRLVDDINSGNLKPTVINRFNEVFASTATGQHLLSDYYFVQDHMH
jgi:hypothetical protein